MTSELPKLHRGSRWDDGAIVDIEGTRIEVSSDGNPCPVVWFGDDSNAPDQCAFADDVLALLDTNNLNTTANELREQVAKLRARLRVEFDRDKSDETDDAAHRLHATGYDAGIKFALDALDGIK